MEWYLHSGPGRAAESRRRGFRARAPEKWVRGSAGTRGSARACACGAGARARARKRRRRGRGTRRGAPPSPPPRPAGTGRQAAGREEWRECAVPRARRARGRPPARRALGPSGPRRGRPRPGAAASAAVHAGRARACVRHGHARRGRGQREGGDRKLLGPAACTEFPRSAARHRCPSPCSLCSLRLFLRATFV